MHSISSFFLLKIITLNILLSICLGAQQVSFKKVPKNNSQIHYTYNVYNPISSDSFFIDFLLKEEHLRSSYTMVPSLSSLKQRMKPELEKSANAIIESYSKNLNQELKNELKHIQNMKLRSKYYSYRISCEKDNPITLSFKYDLNGSYSYTSKITACSIVSNSNQAWTKKVKQISNVLDKANQKLKYGSKMVLIKGKNNYKVTSKLVAPNQKEANKISFIINQSLREINVIENNFNNDHTRIKQKLVLVKRKVDSLLKKYQNKLSYLKKDFSNEFKSIQDRTFEAYYFKVKRHRNNTTILLNYRRLVYDSLKQVKPISDALYDPSLNQRSQIQKVLTFLQTIPYSPLLGREDKNYSGFYPPLVLINKNRGDCDSKSVAFLAIIHHMFPSMKSIFILTPDHAFVGLQLPPFKKDKVIPFKGNLFVVAEPVGPGLFEIGTDASKRNKAYTIEEIIPIIE